MERLARCTPSARENERFVFQWRKGIIGSKIEDINRKIVLTAKDGLRSCEIGSIVGPKRKDEVGYNDIRDYFRERGFIWTDCTGEDMMLYWG